MADTYRESVLHHERGRWPRITWSGLCIQKPELLQVHSRRDHSLLFISLVHQDLVSASLQTSGHECEAPEGFMVASVWLHPRNILRLYW